MKNNTYRFELSNGDSGKVQSPVPTAALMFENLKKFRYPDNLLSVVNESTGERCEQKKSHKDNLT